MLPEGSMSSSAVVADYLSPDDLNRLTNTLIDKELGGKGITDISEGMQYQVWTLEYDVPTGNFRLYDESLLTDVVLLTVVDVTEVSLTFDQNMQPAIAYVEAGTTKFRYYDAVTKTYVTITIPNAKNPLLTLDEKRDEFKGISDILIFYIRGGAICHRVQRERFEIEHTDYVLPPGESRLLSLGRNRGNRLQVYFRAVN